MTPKHAETFFWRSFAFALAFSDLDFLFIYLFYFSISKSPKKDESYLILLIVEKKFWNYVVIFLL